MPIKVEVTRNYKGFPVAARLQDGNKIVVAEYEVDKGFTITGSRRNLTPAMLELLRLIFPAPEAIKTIENIENIENIESIDLIDRLTLIDTISAITNIVDIANIQSVDLIDNITNLGTLNLLNTVNLIKSISSIDAITDIANLQSLDLIDRITLIDDITNIGTLANLTDVGTINLINTLTTLGTVNQVTNIANIQSVDLIDAITNIGTLANLTTLGTVNEITHITNIDAIDEVTVANVKTTGGTNILIDKLTQGAYTPRNVDLRNDNGVTTPTAPPSNVTATTYKGRFVPRGCRGNINNIQIYCRRTGAGTLTVSYSPQPGMGAVGSVTITPGADWDWKYGSLIDRFWNYDSMFLWVSACSADVSYGYDTTSPTDAFASADSGVTWTSENNRYFMFTGLVGVTVGDVPVSGTINNIPIPQSASEEESAPLNPADATETTALTIDGSGKMLEFKIDFWTFATPSQTVIYYIQAYVDGAAIKGGYFDNRIATQSMIAPSGRCAIGEFFQMDYAAASDHTILTWRLPIEFKRQIIFKVYQSSGAAVVAVASCTYSPIS